MRENEMSIRTGLSIDDCRDKIANFFKEFPDVEQWMLEQVRLLNKTTVTKGGSTSVVFDPRTGSSKEVFSGFKYLSYGYVTTPFGRKRSIPNALHWLESLRLKAERQAGNTPIQSIASDIAMAATVRVHNRLKVEEMKSLVFGFVHDSIKVDTYPGELHRVRQIMHEEMVERPKLLYDWLIAPIDASSEVGISWGTHVELKYDQATGIYKLDGNEKNVKAVDRALSKTYSIPWREVEQTEKSYKVNLMLEAA
jgi:hypothetical protein